MLPGRVLALYSYYPKAYSINKEWFNRGPRKVNGITTKSSFTFWGMSMMFEASEALSFGTE
ncbi:hypothetical protein J2TS4_22060 [Paenibacillus sp. J2TS4]|nr:hypothetical protein J2TS4_22060 [Paenibacillus sp. J2TS4]